MAKKAAVTSRVSAKAKLQDYKNRALAFIQTLRYPETQGAFSVETYEKTPTGVKPNALSAPELAAIVGTAGKLGKAVQVQLNGVGQAAQLDFVFVAKPTALPLDLL